jgi:transglutaminase-like putative cysteine protease
MKRFFALREGWSSWFLLLAMLLSVSWSLEAARWSENLHLLQGVVLPVMVAGLVLARGRIPGFLAHLTSGLLGIVWVGYLGTGFFPNSADWGERVARLVVHVILWGQAAWAGGRSADNLVFVLEMALLIWLLGYAGVWLVFRRHNALAAVVLMGVVLLVNTYYSPEDVTIFLVAFLVLSFLLVVRTSFFEREQEWQQEHIQYNPDLAFYFLRDGALFAILVIAVAWLAPSASANPRLVPLTAPLARPWHRAQQEWNRLFSSIRYPSRTGLTYFGTAFSFSGPVNLSDRPVMTVRANDGRYWRGATYDTYTGDGWVNTDNVLMEVDGTPASLPTPPWRLRVQVLQTYRLLEPKGSLLFAAAQPVQLSVGTSVLLNPTSAGSVASGESLLAADISILYSLNDLFRGQEYQVVSNISHADEQSLRQAGTAYPDWVRLRYLQLPAELPARVRARAEEIVAGLDTPYDKAKAVETYLRGFTYNEKIPAPPPGQDGVDYFLFDIKQGYCDYYASAMAVMLRSVGVPARVASGFSRGEYKPDDDLYVVREQNAHTWVEVYFPGLGWIEFEPTATEPPIIRAATPQEGGMGKTAPGRPTPEPGESFSRLNPVRDVQVAGGRAPRFTGLRATLSRSLLRLGVWFSVATLATIVGLALAGLWVRSHRRVSGGPAAAIALFERVCTLGRLGGLPMQSWQTAREYSLVLAKASGINRGPLVRLADLVTRWTYGPHGRGLSDSGAELENLRTELQWPLLRFALRPRPLRLRRWLPRSDA